MLEEAILPEANNNVPKIEVSSRTKLTYFERTIWAAWIAEELISLDKPTAEKGLPFRVGLDYLIKQKRGIVPSVARKWDSAQEDHSINRYGQLLRSMIGGKSALYNDSGFTNIVSAQSFFRKRNSDLRSVSGIVECFIAFRLSGYDDVSVTKARKLAELTRGDHKKRSLERHWSWGKQAAHLIFGLCQVFPETENLMDNVFNISRQSKQNDVVRIISTARYAKQMLSVKARNATESGSAASLSKLFKEPSEFGFSKYNPTAMTIFQQSEFAFTPEKISEVHLDLVRSRVRGRGSSA